MLSAWFDPLLAVATVSAISFVGVFSLSLNEKRLRRLIFVLVALSAGALFGDAFFHLLPEMYETATNSTFVSLLVLGGILLFFMLEKFLAWGHTHEIEPCPDCAEHEIKPIGRVNLAADGLHNFLDGVAIASSFLVAPTIGWATTLAVILHEIPQEIGDFGILLHAGYSRGRALFFNLLSALLAVVGAFFVLLLGQQVAKLEIFLLPLAAGGFLYIAGSDLVPELHKTTGLRRSVIQLLAFLVGILAMYLLLFIE